MQSNEGTNKGINNNQQESCCSSSRNIQRVSCMTEAVVSHNRQQHDYTYCFDGSHIVLHLQRYGTSIRRLLLAKPKRDDALPIMLQIIYLRGRKICGLAV